MSEPIIRVVRVLEFIGPQSWIDSTLEKSWLQPDQDPPQGLGEDKGAREVLRVREVVSDAR